MDGLDRPYTLDDHLVSWGAKPTVQRNWLAIALAVAVLLLLTVTGTLAYVVRQYATMKPLVMVEHVDGFVEALRYDGATLKANQRMARHFLLQFAEWHWSLRRASAFTDFDKSLQFLEPKLRRSRITADDGGEQVKAFMRAPGQDDVIARPTQLVFSDLQQTADGHLVSGRAILDYETDYVLHLSGQVRTTKKFSATVRFVLADRITQSADAVNPIGLTITELATFAAP